MPKERIETAKKFYTDDEQNHIVQAIREWEKNSYGEIKIHLEDNCKGDAVEQGKKWFKKLGLANTEKKTGVLIYMAVKTHRFAVLGDSGIDLKVEPGFWESVVWIIEEHFKDQLYVEGVIEAIKMIGRTLEMHFPNPEDRKNEIPNDLSFG